METREELGIGGLSIGRPIEEGPDGFDRFEHAVNSLFARIDGKTKEILPWMRGTLADAREGFLSESRAVPELAAIALNGTIVQMSAREAEAITRMPARQSTGEPAPHEPQDPKKPNPFDRAEAVLQRGAEALKRGTQNIWENAKQSVGQAYDTTRRSLGKNTTGSLIEIDTTADLLPQIQPSHKRSASILALPPGGRGEYALVGRNGDGNPYVQIVSPSDTRP